MKPQLDPDRCLAALQSQLAALDSLKSKLYHQVESFEQQWTHLTQSIIEQCFGANSSNISKFTSARWAGQHVVGGGSEQLKQSNFDRRIRAYEALLLSPMDEMKLLHLPKSGSQGVYEAGDEYAFYRDLNTIVRDAKREVFIVDAYINKRVFDLYVSEVPTGVKVRILSNSLDPTIEIVAKMYAQKSGLEFRLSKQIHDRLVFVDERGWVAGQSLKDAARTKTTYMVEVSEPSLGAERKVHEEIWSGARVLI